MKNLQTYISKMPTIWMRNAFLIGLVWTAPFLISNYQPGLEGIARVALSIILPISFFGAVWGTFEQKRLTRILNSENKHPFGPSYFLIKVLEGGMIGLAYSALSDSILISMVHGNADISYILEHLYPNFGSLEIGAIIGIVVGYFMRRRFRKFQQSISTGTAT